jgi:hypothetical protein
MKIYSLAAGFGLGYVFGNETARRKTMEYFRQMKDSKQAKSLEHRVSEKVTDLTSRDDFDLSDPNSMSTSMRTPSSQLADSSSAP